MGVLVHTRGEITRASLDLRQIFLHPRTAIEEPDKIVKPDFRFTPSPSSSSRARTDGGSLRQQNEFSKSGLTTFKARFEGNGKTRVLF